MGHQISVLAKQRVNNHLKVIGIVQCQVAHDKPVDNAKRVIGNEEHRPIFWDISNRTHIAINCDIGELECLPKKCLRVGFPAFEVLVMGFHFLAAKKPL